MNTSFQRFQYKVLRQSTNMNLYIILRLIFGLLEINKNVKNIDFMDCHNKMGICLINM